MYVYIYIYIYKSDCPQSGAPASGGCPLSSAGRIGASGAHVLWVYLLSIIYRSYGFIIVLMGYCRTYGLLFIVLMGLLFYVLWVYSFIVLLIYLFIYMIIIIVITSSSEFSMRAALRAITVGAAQRDPTPEIRF